MYPRTVPVDYEPLIDSKRAWRSSIPVGLSAGGSRVGSALESRCADG